MIRLLSFVLTVALLANPSEEAAPYYDLPPSNGMAKYGCEIVSSETMDADSGEARSVWLLRLYAEQGGKRVWGRYCGRHGTYHQNRREAFEHCDRFLDDVRSKVKQTSKK